MRIIHALLILFLAVSSAGCTAYVFNHLDSILTGRIDGYLDLDDAQEEDCKSIIRAQVAWLRGEGFDRVQAFLRGCERRFQAGLTPADASWIAAEMTTLTALVAGRVLPDASAFLSRLGEANASACAKRMEKDERKRAGNAPRDAAERLDRRVKESRKEIERWTDDLDDGQVRRLREVLRTLPDTHDLRHRLARERRSEFVELIGKPREAVAAALRAWFVAPEANWPAWYREAGAAERRSYMTLLLAVDKLLTPAQRAHVIEECRNWQAKIEGLR